MRRGHFAPYRGKCRRWHWLALLLIAGWLTVMLFTMLDARLRPVAITLARAELDNQVSGAVNAVCGELTESGVLRYDRIITVSERHTEGQNFTELTTDMALLNRLRMQIGKAVSQRLDGTAPSAVKVPIGAVLHWNVLTSLGPMLNIPILHVGMMGTSFEHEFTSTGINQTLHRVKLVVKAEVLLLLAGGVTQQEVSYTIPLAESVLVGEIPQIYTNADNADNTNKRSEFDRASDSNAVTEEVWN